MCCTSSELIIAGGAELFSPRRGRKRQFLALPSSQSMMQNRNPLQQEQAALNFPPHYLHTFGRALSRLVLCCCKKSGQKPKQLSLNPFQSWEKRPPQPKRDALLGPRTTNVCKFDVLLGAHWIPCDRRKLDVNKLNHGARGLSQFSCHAIRENILCVGKEAKSGLGAHPPCAKQLVFYLWNIFVLALPSLWNIIIRYWVLFAAWRAPTGTRMRACLFVMRPSAGVFVFVCGPLAQPQHSLTRPAISSHQHH